MQNIVKIMLLGLVSMNIVSQEIDVQKEIQELKKTSQEQAIETTVNIEDSLNDKVEKESIYFGYNFFNKKTSTKTPILDLPLQGNYEISLNDELELLLTGNIKQLYKLRVDLAGNVLIPNIGKINLKDLTLAEAEEKLSVVISNSYSGVTSNLSISVPALKKISVIGAVNNPGTFLVNPFVTIIESIMYAEGLIDGASLRKITVKSLTGEEKVYDLYDFLLSGNIQANKSLRNGDTVIIKTTNNFVEVKGSVFREKKYEYLNEDSIADVISYALGINENGDPKNIAIEFEKNGVLKSSLVDLNFELEGKKVYKINIGSSVLNKDLYLSVNGSTVSQGFLPFAKGEQLSSFISQIDTTEDTYPYYAVLVQKEGEFESKKYFFSLADKSTYENIALATNPYLYFFSRDEIIENSYDPLLVNPQDIVYIDTGVRSLSLPILGSISAKHIAEYLGITHRIDKTVTAYGEDELTLSYESKFDASNIEYFSFVEKKANLISVRIFGEVNSPGIFNLPSGSSLQDLYDVAGGFTNRSFERGIVFTRQSLKDQERNSASRARQVILDSIMQNNSFNGDFDSLIELIKFSEDINYAGRLTGDFSPEQFNAKNTPLLEGDSIFVPVYSNQIIITGEVLNPMSIVYDSNVTYQELIKLSGNFTEYADKSAGYVIRADGTSFPLESNYFENQIYPEPGDIIVIPRDYEKVTGLPLVSTAAKILADIAFAAASLNAIQN